MANSGPVVIASDQSALPSNITQLAGTAVATNQGAASAGTLRTVLANEQIQDLNITGQAGQTAANQNIVLATAGTGSTDANGYRTVAIQIIPTGTVSSGVVTFEGSNDNTTFVAIPMYDEASLTANPVTTVSPATGVNRFFSTPLHFRYFRARISTIIGGGGSIAAVTRFSQTAYAPEQYTVMQATAANLNATVTGTVTANLGTGGTGATSLGKARDAAAAGTDTNVGVMLIRRDTPTAVTPIAGDYEVPQMSANGEQWVRLAGELADDAAFTLGTTRVLPLGVVAVSMDGTDPASVSAEGDAAVPRSDLNRILLVNQTHPRYFRASVDYASAQTNATVVAAPGAGLSLWVTDVIISNGAVAGNITLLDGSGGSVVLEAYPGINGGLTHSFRNPLKLTANTLLAITSTTVTTHTVTVTGYIAA